MKKSKILLTAALVAVLVTVLAVGSTLAYFTAHAEAKGSAKVVLGYHTTIDEEFDAENNKIVTIHNDGPESVWVRVKAYSAYKFSYKATKDWVEGEQGYCYYGTPLGAGDTEPLTIFITAPESESNTAEFNVVVVYEYTKVLYDKDGKPYADWSLAVKMEGGEE